MLVLSRKVGDRIQIGDNIEITVSEIRGNVIRLGITAPADVRILRGELLSADAESAEEGPTSAAQEVSSKPVRGLHSRRSQDRSCPSPSTSAMPTPATPTSAAMPSPSTALSCVVPWNGVTGNAMVGKATG